MSVSLQRYDVIVLPDEGGKPSHYVVESEEPIDSRLLLICGLILDDGCPPDVLRELLPTAQAYAHTHSTYRKQWVDAALRGETQSNSGD